VRALQGPIGNKAFVLDVDVDLHLLTSIADGLLQGLLGNKALANLGKEHALLLNAGHRPLLRAMTTTPALDEVHRHTRELRRQQRRVDERLHMLFEGRRAHEALLANREAQGDA
jgi:hypothetical protein